MGMEFYFSFLQETFLEIYQLWGTVNLDALGPTILDKLTTKGAKAKESCKLLIVNNKTDLDFSNMYLENLDFPIKRQ